MYKYLMLNEFEGELDFSGDIIMDLNNLKKIFPDYSFSSGKNTIEWTLTNKELPDILNKGLKVTATMDILVSIDNKDQCIYSGMSFDLFGKGAKKYYNEIRESISINLIENNCIYNYIDDSIPDFDNATDFNEKKSIFININRTGVYNQQTLSIERVEFNHIHTVNHNNIKESSTKHLFAVKTNNMDKYLVFNDTLYILDRQNYVTEYSDVQKYFKYKGNNHSVLITELGLFVKVKELKLLSDDDIICKFNEVDRYGDTIKALYVNNTLLFEYNLDDMKYSNKNIDIYFIENTDGSISLYYVDKHFLNTTQYFKIEAEVIFETNITPDIYSKEYDYSYLKSGAYITSIINGVRMILAPVSYKALNDVYKDELSLYIWNNNFYGIIGEYDKTGFIVDSQYFGSIYSYINFGSIYSYISKIPKNSNTSFYYSIDEVKEHFDRVSSHVTKSPSDIKFKSYDDRFLVLSKDFNVGDTVKVIREPNENSNIKNLEGTVLKISNNKQEITICFFGYFETVLNKEFIKII